MYILCKHRDTLPRQIPCCANYLANKTDSDSDSEMCYKGIAHIATEREYTEQRTPILWLSTIIFLHALNKSSHKT